MKSGERGSSGAASRIRGTLVVCEASLAMVVLTAAALLVGSFNRLNPREPGFAFANRTKFSVRLAGPRYAEPAARAAAVEEISARLQALPGVIDASSATHVPLTGTSTVFPARVDDANSAPVNVHFRAVLPNYLGLMGMPIVRGHGLEEAGARSLPVAVVNETFVSRVLKGREPLGSEVTIEEPAGAAARRIVGVVRDVRASGGNLRGWPEVFVPYAQSPLALATFVVHAERTRSEVESAIRRVIGEFDAMLPVDRVETMTAVMARSVATQRFFATLMIAFAIVAVSLACVGLYSVAAWSVSQRTREIGVRLAVGATPRDIGRLVLGYGVTVGLAGAAIGALSATASSRLIESYLFGFSAHQPALLAGLAIALTIIVALACYVPARRAMRVDPMVALRMD